MKDFFGIMLKRFHRFIIFLCGDETAVEGSNHGDKEIELEAKKRSIVRIICDSPNIDIPTEEYNFRRFSSIHFNSRSSPHVSRRLSTLVEEGSDAEAEESLNKVPGIMAHQPPVKQALFLSDGTKNVPPVLHSYGNSSDTRRHPPTYKEPPNYKEAIKKKVQTISKPNDR